MICKYSSAQPQILDLRKPQDYYYFDFQFPYSQFKSHTFKQPNQISQHLIRLGVKYYFLKGRVYIRDDYLTKHTIKVTFKCKSNKCPARLTYFRHKHQPYMSIIQFNNLHRHKKCNHPQKARRQQINQFILHLRGEEYEQYRKVIKWIQKFDVSHVEGLYITEQVYWYNNTEDWILGVLAHQGNIVRRVTRKKMKMKTKMKINQIQNKPQHQHKQHSQQPQHQSQQQQQTQLIFLATPTMLQSHLQYGQTITIQIYHQTIKQRPSIGQSYGIGYIFGQDNNMNIVLLAIFIIVQESKQMYKRMLDIYVECMCAKRKRDEWIQYGQYRQQQYKNRQSKPQIDTALLPLTIITDQIKQLSQAIQQLKQQHNYKYTHVHPWCHITRKLKTKLKNAQLQNGRQIMQVLCLAMQQKSEIEYYWLMCQAKTMLYKQNKHNNGHRFRHMFDQFVQHEQRYCYRRLPKIFSGFGISTKYGTKVLKKVQNPCVYKVHTGRLYHKLLKIEKHLLAAAEKVRPINYQLIKYCPIQVNSLYGRIQGNIMEVILGNYHKSRECTIEYVDAITIKVLENNKNNKEGKEDKEGKEGKEDKDGWICKFMLQYDHWQCQCMEIVHTGIPCSHIMRILLDSNIRGSIEYYINSRWIHSKVDKSRRNMRGQSITNRNRRRH